MRAYIELVPLLLLAVGLSAACGFRVFVPPLLMGVAAHEGWVELSSGLAWLADWRVIIVLGLASVLEVAAYYIPWVDNLLDTVASPAAVIAGTLLTATLLSDYDPALKWGLGVIAGGGAAAVTQATTVTARAASTGMTGGLGNFLVATFEAVMAFLFVVISFVLPILAVLLLVGIVFLLVRLVMRLRAKTAASATS